MNWQNNRPVYYAHPALTGPFWWNKVCSVVRRFTVVTVWLNRLVSVDGLASCTCIHYLSWPHAGPLSDTFLLYTVPQKTVQICFCQNFVKFTSILIIFGRKMAKRLKLYEMHLFSTSPNSRHHTTVLKADVPKCYRTLNICIKLSINLVSTNKLKCGFFSRIISSYKVRLKIVRICVRSA